MDIEKLQELLNVFEASGLSEIEIEEAGTRIRLKKSQPPLPSVSPYPAMHHSQIEEPGPGVASHPVSRGANFSEDSGVVTINSPMVGVFYVAPAPDQPPFVRPGDVVQEHQTVCIVEAMKLMNEVSTHFPARILKVLAENGEPVEFGQPLFAVEPLD
ncbi:MAG TPA: acetyl-CoA carboxylase biotin carboxyl carrier protein [Candidatus Hydrogenedentes bacterium]|nr:acetyl-CoA carboxylase biotin carboxyl carrier protein [Candidatus Hydrogenedentota bacterium]HQE84407.1 acetyl-CoA carboxylase biotin carboxyl carrier protein [Candidatus Hydrogenedentota bacterium]HQH53203.1 acetyl-CoA carboxylase biotin carboxyl carrier protein [Candidatus Hydrogenedentota bacterium]HQM50943.1 acetyl-CoA carboxylase biotin carboxyl carrier protein [Candidatus Hydrogenedentota bacterium]